LIAGGMERLRANDPVQYNALLTDLRLYDGALDADAVLQIMDQR